VIPNNIIKEHIVSAINEIDRNGYPIIREPTKYYINTKKKPIQQNMLFPFPIFLLMGKNCS